MRNKKIILIGLILIITLLAAGDLFAKKRYRGRRAVKEKTGIIVKGGYTITEDSEALGEYDNAWNAGLFIDTGSMLTKSVHFRAGLDYITIKTPMEDASIIGLHFEWIYNVNISGSPIVPFIGLGPSLNYVDWGKSSESAFDDSEVGIEAFGGVAYAPRGGRFEFFIEGRYRNIDIAYRKKYMYCANLGVMIKI